MHVHVEVEAEAEAANSNNSCIYTKTLWLVLLHSLSPWNTLLFCSIHNLLGLSYITSYK